MCRVRLAVYTTSLLCEAGMIAIHALQWQARKPDAAAVAGHTGGDSHGGVLGSVTSNAAAHTAAVATVTAIMFAGNVFGLRRTLRMLAGARRVMAALIRPTVAVVVTEPLPSACVVRARCMVDQQRHIIASMSVEHARICMNGGLIPGGACSHPSSARAVEAIPSVEPTQEHGVLGTVVPQTALLPSRTPLSLVPSEVNLPLSSAAHAVNSLVIASSTFVQQAKERMDEFVRAHVHQSTHAEMQSKQSRLPLPGSGNASLQANQGAPPQSRVCFSSRVVLLMQRCMHGLEHH